MYFLTGPVHHFYSYRIRVKRKKKSKRLSPFTAFLFHISFLPQTSALYLMTPPLHENTLAEISTITWLPSAKLLNSFNLKDTPHPWSCVSTPSLPKPFPPLISGTAHSPCSFASLNNHSIALFSADFSSGLSKI